MASSMSDTLRASCTRDMASSGRFTSVDTSTVPNVSMSVNRRMAMATRAAKPPETCCASVLDAPLTQADAAELAKAFAALADPVRLRLLSMIAAAGEICSCDLQGPLGRSQPTVSHHTTA